MTPVSGRARIRPLLLAVGLAVTMGAGACSTKPTAAPATETTAPGSSGTSPDSPSPTSSPPGAQLTLASTTLVVGETMTVGGTGCPAGDRGNLGILPDRAVTLSDGQSDFIDSAVAGDDERWSFAAPVPGSVVGAAWTIANCEDVDTGTVVFTYPRVAVTVKPAPTP